MEAVVLIFLVLVNGVLAMTEVAIVAARRARIERMAESGDPLARAALAVTEHPTRSLSTIQIGITSIGILNGIVGEAAFARPLATWAESLGAPAHLSYVLATGLVVVIVTYLSIVFGELVPKRIGQINPEPLLRVLANPLLALGTVSAPFVRLLSASTEFVLRLLGAHRPATLPVTEEEIDLLLAEGSKAGVIEDEERRMVQNVFRLDDITVTSLMMPSSDVISLDLDEPLERNLLRMEASDHARYPVGHGGLRRVVGVVTARRLLLHVRRGGEVDLGAVLDPAVFVPETLTASELLQQFRSTGAHMVFVVGEYGDVQGLVTEHDLLEAIAGEFQATGADSWAVRRDDGSWLLDGSLPIADLKNRLGLARLPEEERRRYRTLGGMLLLLLGRIPRPGDHVEWDRWRLEVMDMDGRRIDKVMASPRAD